MRTTVLALALMFTLAIAANASTTTTPSGAKTGTTMVAGSNTLAKAGKAKKAHHKKHGKSHSTKKHNKK